MSSPNQKKPTKIAIVGAGLGGLALALFLRKSDTSLIVSILEARPSDAADGGYLALAPNALHVLDQLGLYESLLPHGFAYEEMTFYSARNLSHLGAVLNGSRESYGYPALRIERHIVRQTLMKAVRDAGVQIRFNTKVKSIAAPDQHQGPTITLDNGATETVNLVIGADGIHSRVRQLLSDVDPVYAGQIGIGGGKLSRKDVDQSLSLPGFFMGKTNAFAMMPTTADGETVSCFATIEMEAQTREGWSKLASDKDGLKQRLVDRHCGPNSEWPSIVQTACQQSQADSMAIWPFFSVPVLDFWSSKDASVILIGDAAHAMPPTGGQGAAQAFEDAASLARVIVETLDTAAFRSRIEEWQSTRQDRVRQVKAFTTKGGDMRRASPSLLQQIVKEWAIWLWMWWSGRDAGLGWIYGHREQGPSV